VRAVGLSEEANADEVRNPVIALIAGLIRPNEQP
jgi:hypothetical protein